MRHQERIGYHGELSDIAEAVCSVYKIGAFKSCSLFDVGYEDFNFSLQTDCGQYFAKVFSSFRNLDDCSRYIDVMRQVIARGVATPLLLGGDQGVLCRLKVNSTDLRLCILQHIDGENLFALKYSPTHDEIKFLGRQAALIAAIEINPPFVYDSWAIVNLPKEFAEKGKCLAAEEYGAIRSLVQEYDDLEIKSLPHCFVHGDLIATNILRDKSGKLWIVDFAASNYYPRIQELAVLACNVLFDPENKAKTDANLKIMLDEYQRSIPLTPKEILSLPAYIKFAHAMHVLRGTYEKVANRNNSPENDYWIEQGRMGLQQTIDE